MAAGPWYSQGPAFAYRVVLISRVLSRRAPKSARHGQPFLFPGRCRRGTDCPCEQSERSTRPLSDRTSQSAGAEGGCLILHAVGFAMPRLSPAERCALTAPFHPCLCDASVAIGGLLSAALSLALETRIESSGGWALPTTVSFRARTFLGRRNPRPRLPCTT